MEGILDVNLKSFLHPMQPVSLGKQLNVTEPLFLFDSFFLVGVVEGGYGRLSVSRQSVFP